MTRTFKRPKNKPPQGPRLVLKVLMAACIVASTHSLMTARLHVKNNQPIPTPTIQNHLPLSPDKLRIIEVLPGESYDQADRRNLLESKNTKILEISMYTSRIQETDESPEIAANNQNIWHLLQAGEQTCAANAYPFGTRLSIEGLGVCVVRDRMNRRYPDNVDWYGGYDLQRALKFGRQKLKVTKL